MTSQDFDKELDDILVDRCPNGCKVLYRYEISYKNYEDDTDIYLRELKVLQETDKTYLVQNHYYQKKRIRKSSYNAYAHAQKEKALEHFVRRTNKRIRWYEYWTEECKKSLELAENMKGDDHQ